jgi:hypothetical protein
MKTQAMTDTVLTGLAGLSASAIVEGSDAVVSAAQVTEMPTEVIQIVIQIVIGVATLLKLWKDSRKARKNE